MSKRTIPAELMKRLMLKRLRAQGDLALRLSKILNRFSRPLTQKDIDNSKC